MHTMIETTGRCTVDFLLPNIDTMVPIAAAIKNGKYTIPRSTIGWSVQAVSAKFTLNPSGHSATQSP